MPDVKPEGKGEKQTRLAAKTVKREKSNSMRWQAIKRFFSETRSEFKKIVWPAPKQVLNNTIVVIAMIVFVGVIIWLLDGGTSYLLNAFLAHYSS